MHDNARSIAARCAEAEPDELVVAAVSPDMVFRGVWLVAKDELGRQVAALDDGGWSLVFDPDTPTAEIKRRALELADLVYRRWVALRRRVSRQP